MTSAKEHGIDVPMSQDFESMPGRGVRAVVEERSLHVGGPGLLRMLAVEPPETLRRAAEAAAADGQSATYLVEGDKVLAVFAIADAIRPESFDAVKRLHASGLEVVLLTGDSTAVATAVANARKIGTILRTEASREGKKRRTQ